MEEKSSSQNGAATEIQLITVTHSEQPKILEYYVDKSTIYSGDNFSFNILTSPNIKYVWAVVDGKTVYGENYSFDDSANMYWQIQCNPAATQGIEVYASFSSTDSDTAMEIIYVTVIEE